MSLLRLVGRLPSAAAQMRTLSSASGVRRLCSTIAQMHTPGITYTLSGAVYVQLTEQAAGTTLLASRGPSFRMPATSGFAPISRHHPDRDPNPDEVISALEKTFAAGYDTGEAASHEGDLKGLTFAGAGDPLSQHHSIDTLCQVARWVRHARPGTPITVSTLGLVKSEECSPLIDRLKESGVERVSVLLNASNPVEYKRIMRPDDGLSFNDVCAFIGSCTENGLSTICTAVESPKLKMAPIMALANSLGADFKSRTYHP